MSGARNRLIPRNDSELLLSLGDRIWLVVDGGTRALRDLRIAAEQSIRFPPTTLLLPLTKS